MNTKIRLIPSILQLLIVSGFEIHGPGCCFVTKHSNLKILGIQKIACENSVEEYESGIVLGKNYKCCTTTTSVVLQNYNYKCCGKKH